MGLTRISNWVGNKNQIYENLIDEALFRTRCCIPCIVQSYDKENNTVECQPAIREKIINEDGSVQYVNLPLLINVPVAFPSSSSFSIKFPINRGDECLVVFSDLSIDNFWLKSGVQNQVEVRRHDLSDGIAIPCSLSLVKANSFDSIPVRIEVENNDLKITTESGSFTGKQLYNIVYGHTHNAPEGGGLTSGPLGV